MHNNKIKTFVRDIEMKQAVKLYIRELLLKPSKETDVNYLAGKMIALEKLEEAFKDMEKQANIEKINTSKAGQIGL